MEDRNVTKACELMEVSRSAFYDWHQPSRRREVADAELGKRIEKIHAESRGAYGAPRVHRSCATTGCTSGGSGWPGSWPPGAWPAGASGAGQKTTIADPDAQAASI